MSSGFEVHLTRNAEEGLLELGPLAEKAANELLVLKGDPHKGHPLKGSLRGARALEFSLQGVAYRAAYVVLKKERVWLVFMVGPHPEVQLARRGGSYQVLVPGQGPVRG